MLKMMRVLLLMLGVNAPTGLAAPMVDVNAADAAQLDAMLEGVGEKKAQLLVAWRNKHGPFRSLADVANVEGFGSKLAQRNQANMIFGPVVAPAVSQGTRFQDKDTLILPLR